MEIIETESFDCIKNICTEISVNNLDKYIFYRGTKVDYLLPSIVPQNNKFEISQLTKIEMKLLEIFKLIYPKTFANEDDVTKNWLYRIKAREHGLASRLIDWSNFFDVALEFATNIHHPDMCDKYVYLWILAMDETELLFAENLKNYPFENLTSSHFLRGVLYDRNVNIATRRQFVQGGNFLVQPIDCFTTRLNEQPFFSKKLSCIKIPIECIREIRKDIAIYNYKDIESNSLIIDDENWIDSVCNVLNEKFLYSVNSRI